MRFEVSDEPRYVPVLSKTKFCARCLERLVELTPVFKRGMAAEYFRKRKRLPTVRLICPRGCAAGWADIADPRVRRRHG